MVKNLEHLKDVAYSLCRPLKKTKGNTLTIEEWSHRLGVVAQPTESQFTRIAVDIYWIMATMKRNTTGDIIGNYQCGY